MLRDRSIDVVHAFLFDADIATRVAGRKAKTPVVVTSERNADYHRPLIHRLAFRITRNWFDAMIANSHAGKAFNIRTQRLEPKRILVVPNGVDVQRFRPQPDRSLRSELGIGADALVVGMVASFKPQKNHQMFARFANRLLQKMPDVRFILAGGTLDAEGNSQTAIRSNARMHKVSHAYFDEIRRLLTPLVNIERLLLLGNRTDMHRVYNTCDVTVLTSHHEGTSNVILESMACGVPVVATDVSDNRRIIADDSVGLVTAPDDDHAMADAVYRLLSDDKVRQQASTACRQWVLDEFSNRALARRTGDIYCHLLSNKRRG